MQTLAASGWLQFLVMLVLIANLAAVVVGVTLMLRPDQVRSWFAAGTRPRSLRQLLKPLETVRDSDRVLLVHPKPLGVLLIAGALYVLARGGWLLAAGQLGAGGEMLAWLFPGWRLPTAAWEILWLAFVWCVALGALLGLVAGVLALTRVDLLAQLAGAARRWVSLRNAAKPIARPYYGVDTLLQRYPRTVGAVISVVALYVVAIIIACSVQAP